MNKHRCAICNKPADRLTLAPHTGTDAPRVKACMTCYRDADRIKWPTALVAREWRAGNA